MKRAILAIPSVLLAAGCIPFVPVPFVCPTVSQTAPLNIHGPKDDIRVFRVDVRSNLSGPEFNDGDCYTLRELGVIADRWVLPQTRVAADYGFVWNCIALMFHEHIHHSILMRLYRPGFDCVEIKSWHLAQGVEWRSAPGLSAQESAIDSLVATPGWQQSLMTLTLDIESREPKVPGCDQLAPGSSSSAHRDSLLFAASEYERLAAADWPNEPEQHAARERLRDKACHLRECAGK